MKNSFPFLTRVVFLVVLPILFVYWWAIEHYLKAPLPKTEVTYSLDWQGKSASLQRNDTGIAVISGPDIYSVHYAMGYAHAQDRLWQLELQKYISQGRLSELFGKSTLQQDMFIRTLGLTEAAQKAYSGLSIDAKTSLSAYAEGVNAFIKEGNTLPVEFKAMGITPSPWTELDSMMWLKMFAFNLSANYIEELQRLLVLKYLPQNQQATFFPDLQQNALLETKVALSNHDLSSLIKPSLPVFESLLAGRNVIGSNAWAVSGRHTASGKPLLASDPHLGLQLPSIWYVAVQNIGEHHLSGFSLVGVPAISFGRNQDFAWGGNNMNADVQDLVIEQLKPNDHRYYRSNDGWKKFESRIETIKVKADFPSDLRVPTKPIEMMVRETKNGPIVSNLLGLPEVAISLRWSALDDDDATYQALFETNLATDWNSFREALKKIKVPAMNIVYADSSGNIALQGVGAVPLRRSGVGVLPSENESYADIWNGYVPFAELPFIFNPEQGYLANANNPVLADGPHINADWGDSSRMHRIEQLLEQPINASKKLSIQDMKKMQLDLVDLSVAPLLTVMKQVEGQTEKQKELLNHLANWNGEASERSVAATVYYFWLKNIKSSLFDSQLSKIWRSGSESGLLMSLSGKVSTQKIAQILSTDDAWCSMSIQDLAQTCDNKMYLALVDTIDELTLLIGNDINDWQWGAVHKVDYKNQPFSEINGVKDVFGREYRAAGSSNTLNVAGSDFESKLGYSKSFGAGFRQVVAFNDGRVAHWVALAGGQSGQVASDHYDDLLEQYEQGKFLLLPESIERLKQVTDK